MTNTGIKNDSKSQLDKFKEAAREIECDDDKDVFTEKLKKLVTPKKPADSK